MVYTPEEWTGVQREDPRLFTTKAVKVPIVTAGKNPLPSHVLVSIADHLFGLANRYMAVAKNPEWQRASEWPRVMELSGACEMANKHLRDILRRQSRIIDPPEKEMTAREKRDHDNMESRVRKLFPPKSA